MLEADRRPPRRAAAASAGRARCRSSGVATRRPRRLLAVGQARVLHAHATRLFRVVVVGHHADHERRRPVALLRAGASARCSVRRAAAGDLEVRLVAASCRGRCACDEVTVNSPPNLVPTPLTLTLQPALIAGLPKAMPSASKNASAIRCSVDLAISLASPLLAATRSVDRGRPAAEVAWRPALRCDARPRRRLRAAGAAVDGLLVLRVPGADLDRLSACWMPLMRGRKVIMLSCHVQRRRRARGLVRLAEVRASCR